MAIPVLSKAAKKVFGTRNDRLVKRYLRVVDLVSEFEPQMRALDDADLRLQRDLVAALAEGAAGIVGFQWAREDVGAATYWVAAPRSRCSGRWRTILAARAIWRTRLLAITKSMSSSS